MNHASMKRTVKGERVCPAVESWSFGFRLLRFVGRRVAGAWAVVAVGLERPLRPLSVADIADMLTSGWMAGSYAPTEAEVS